VVETVVRDMQTRDDKFEFLFVKGYQCITCRVEWPC
jgi:hypothetical protein